jgi:hypothetical protein
MKKAIAGVLVSVLLLVTAAFAQDAPLWLLRRTAVYPSELYVSGVGEGGSAEEAQTRALAQVSQFFQTRVRDARTLLYTYNNALLAAENTQVSQNTAIRSEVEFFNVEFADIYRDGAGVYHALAYIDRKEAVKKYDARIQANVRALGDLIKRYDNSPNPRLAIRRLFEARRLAVVTAEYADMATLLSSDAAPRYSALPAIITAIDGAIEANEKRLTATITLNNESARPIAQKTAELLRRADFRVTDSGGVYTVFINFTANENTTKNYRTVEPLLEIIIEAQDGTPLITYTKKYPVFRHVTREEALSRAVRNIEQDLGGEFFTLTKEIGR